jgi:APA family basic amino acid/polyamine antiporter
VGHDHFVAPSYLPVIGAIVSAIFLFPLDRDTEIYILAVWLLIGGLVLWAINYAITRRPGTVVAEEADLTRGPDARHPDQPPR